MAGLVVLSAPASEPITTAEAKTYLRITGSSEDTFIDTLIKTARMFCEEYTNRALISQTLVLTVDAYNEMADPLWEGVKTGPYLNYYKNYIDLPRPPVTSVTSVKTYDDDDTATTMSSTKYYVDTARESARVVLRTGETFPTALRVANAIEVTYVAGYASANAVPEPLKLGMYQIIAHLYEHRGDMYDSNMMTPMTKRLFAPYIVYGGSGSSKFMALG